MRIGDLGRRTGVAVKTIRYYEEIGLLPAPDRTASGYRDYEEVTVDRLRFIREAQGTGLSLTEIASILDLRDHGQQTCGHVVELLEQHLEDIDRQIRDLRRTKSQLAAMTERAKALDPSDCLDPNRCQTISVGAEHVPKPGRGLHGLAHRGHRHPTSDRG